MIQTMLRRLLLSALACTLGVQAGCGVLTARKSDFTNAETGEDGQIYVLDDLRSIANDDDLSEAQKRDAFRDLGIEDEDLIAALLEL